MDTNNATKFTTQLGEVKILMLKGEKGDTGEAGISGDYSGLINKPSINGVQLEGNKTSDDLALASVTRVDQADSAISALGNDLDALSDSVFQYRRQLTSSDDIDDIKEIGTYWYGTASVPANAYYQNASVLEVITTGVTSSQIIQRLTRFGAMGYSAFRVLYNSSWSAWREILLAPEGETNATFQSGITSLNSDMSTAKSNISTLQSNVTSLQNEDSKILKFREVLTSSNDLNRITTLGIYRYSSDNVPKNAFYQNASILEVSGMPDGSMGVIQRLTRYGAAGYTAFRVLGGDSTWSAWKELATAETSSIDITGLNVGGYITGNSSTLRFSVPIEPVKGTLSLGLLYLAVRHANGGYAYAKFLGADSWTPLGAETQRVFGSTLGTTCTITKLGGALNVNVAFPNALKVSGSDSATNVPNNTPVGVMCDIRVDIS